MGEGQNRHDLYQLNWFNPRNPLYKNVSSTLSCLWVISQNVKCVTTNHTVVLQYMLWYVEHIAVGHLCTRYDYFSICSIWNNNEYMHSFAHDHLKNISEKFNISIIVTYQKLKIGWFVYLQKCVSKSEQKKKRTIKYISCRKKLQLSIEKHCKGRSVKILKLKCIALSCCKILKL